MKNKVWYYRNQQNISLRRLSAMTGISVSALNKIENEDTNDIWLHHAVAISIALKVD